MRLLVPVVALLALAGCAGGTGGATPSPSPSPPPDAAGTGAAVEAALLARGDVTSVGFRYSDTVTDPGSGTVDVTAGAGADPRALADEALRLVWQSRLRPLHSIGVHVVVPEDPLRGLSEVVDLLDPADTAPLERRYGLRPFS